jgi:hypothetical protein
MFDLLSWRVWWSDWNELAGTAGASEEAFVPLCRRRKRRKAERYFRNISCFENRLNYEMFHVEHFDFRMELLVTKLPSESHYKAAKRTFGRHFFVDKVHGAAATGPLKPAIWDVNWTLFLRNCAFVGSVCAS